MFENNDSLNPIITQDIYSPCDGKVEEWDENYRDNLWISSDKGLAIIKPTSSLLYAPCNGLVTSIYPEKITLISDSGMEITINIKRSKILSEQWVIPLVPIGVRVECHQPIMDLNKKVYHRDCLICLSLYDNNIQIKPGINAYTQLKLTSLKTGKVSYHDKIAELVTEPFSEYSLEQMRKAGIKQITGPRNHLYYEQDFENIISLPGIVITP